MVKYNVDVSDSVDNCTKNMSKAAAKMCMTSEIVGRFHGHIQSVPKI